MWQILPAKRIESIFVFFRFLLEKKKAAEKMPYFRKPLIIVASLKFQLHASLERLPGEK